MTESEIGDRLTDVLSTGEITLYIGRFFDKRKPIPISNLTELGDYEYLTLWVNNSTRDSICSTESKGVNEGQYLFDFYKDPVIQLEKCAVNGKLISPGRLYYKIGWIEELELRELHARITNKVVRIFKKGLTTPKSMSPFKLSDDTFKLLNEGYGIELGPGGLRMNKDNLNGT